MSPRACNRALSTAPTLPASTSHITADTARSILHRLSLTCFCDDLSFSAPSIAVLSPTLFRPPGPGRGIPCISQPLALLSIGLADHPLSLSLLPRFPNPQHPQFQNPVLYTSPSPSPSLMFPPRSLTFLYLWIRWLYHMAPQHPLPVISIPHPQSESPSSARNAPSLPPPSPHRVCPTSLSLSTHSQYFSTGALCEAPVWLSDRESSAYP